MYIGKFKMYESCSPHRRHIGVWFKQELFNMEWKEKQTLFTACAKIRLDEKKVGFQAFSADFFIEEKGKKMLL